MTTLVSSPSPAVFAKLSSVALALCMTFGIFVLMAKLIENNAEPIQYGHTALISVAKHTLNSR